MKNRCSVLRCLNTAEVQLHKFPFNDKLLLPIWIMATNRSNWLPNVKSRMCDNHFSIDDHIGGDKGNMLKADACPIFQLTNSNNITHEKILTDSEDSECSSPSDTNSEDLLDTPNTSDMISSDDDSTLSTSSCNNFSYSNEPTGFYDDFLSSLSDTQFELENIDNEEPMLEVGTVSLSSSITSFTNQPINQECAVVLCNQNARNQFDTLFFITFPKDNITLCECWWRMCGRTDKFDPLLKICSIHFDSGDFTHINILREGQNFRQTTLKTNNIVPTLYLLSQEYTKFTRKRKRRVNDSCSIQNNSTEFEYCIVQGCDKIFLKDGKNTLLFKFPLNDKPMLKKWLDNIGLTNWQPTVTDRICSDHFENDDVLMTNGIYGLNNDAIPSMKSQISFLKSSEDNNGKKRASTVNSRNIDIIFNNLKFDHLDQNSLIVRDITRGEKNESLLINSLKNDFADQEPKFNSSTVQSSSTKLIGNKGKLIKSNFGDDIITLDDVNKHKSLESSIEKCIEPCNEEISKAVTDDSNQSKLVSKPDENNLKNMPTDTSNTITISKNKCISKVKKSHEKSIEKNIFEEKNMISKSRYNENDCDYIYLDMLDGDDAKNMLKFEKKSISKNTKIKILQLLENKHTDGIPKSIIYNQDLTECYDEMLPPYCDQNCQLICYYSIPGLYRKQIYKEFQMLNATEQNCKIAQLVKLSMSKKKDSTFESCFILNKVSIKVCRTFFMNTLGISDKRLDAILKPINYKWYSDRDNALKANQPRKLNVISEPVVMTDFMRESLILLDKDYNS